jgi:glutamate dehydrogenase (NAD(P)+)
VFVVPDFVGGIGGSASMEALFGPRQVPSARAVLDSLAGIMRRLVEDIASCAARLGVTPREAALRLAATADIDHDAPPYGTSRYTR